MRSVSPWAVTVFALGCSFDASGIAESSAAGSVLVRSAIFGEEKVSSVTSSMFSPVMVTSTFCPA